MRKKLFVFVSVLLALSMLLAACAPAAATQAPAAVEPTKAPAATEPAAVEPTATEAAAAEATTAPAEVKPTEVPPTPTLTPYPVADCQAGKVCITWFVGLGTGTDAPQITTQEEVVADFNKSQDKIQLILEIIPYNSARDTLSTQIASGNGPDIVGPVGWGGSNDFYGQWLDIGPYLTELNFDTSIFDPALIKFYQTEEGQVGLPFAVFPGAMYFVPAMFDEAGLAYPPQKYGEKYVLDGKEVDWNWETVTEISRRLTVDKNGVDATQEGFDPSQIVQVGYNAQWQSIQSVATFYGGAELMYSGDKATGFKSTLPDSWKEAFKWYYEGQWGDKPFMANGPLAGSPEFGNGNVFNSGKAAMGLTQTWYTCCLGDFAKAGNEFQLGIQPMGTADGKVHGRLDADTFRIWKGAKAPKEAVEVLTYLITTGADKLLPVYGAMPAIPSKTQAFFDKKAQDYPFVTKESWDVFVQGLAYPDAPSSEQYLPNSIKANARFSTFKGLLDSTKGLDFEAEYQKLVDDLNVIYNEK